MINEVMTPALATYVVVCSILVGIYGAICYRNIRKGWKEGK